MTREPTPQEAAERKARVRAESCSYCGAPAGKPCRAKDGTRISLHHGARHDAAAARQVTR